MNGTIGFDCSNRQGQTKLVLAARAGYRFGLFKGSEGVGYEDAYAGENLRQAADNGLGRGLYHYARPDLSSAQDEAAYYVDIASRRRLGRGDIPIIDMEVAHPGGRQATTDWYNALEQHVREQLRCAPVIYTGKWFVDGYMAGIGTLGANGLWLANYSISQWPAVPLGWDFLAFWQFASAAVVPGIAGEGLVDCFNGDMEQFRAYGLRS